jgi:signal transduction histidine kinase
MRPLKRITDAASQIASGDLGTRVAPEHDRDLEPLVNSFNGMADAVQARIQREERFASDVSHELRSPITALAAATDVLDGRRDEVPERTRQAIDVVITQVRRFDQMVLDLLELSRIDAGAADSHVEPVVLAQLCARIARRFGFDALPVEVQPDAPVTVAIDRVRFERILGNLLDNAMHHAGGPTRIVIGKGPDTFVDVAVEDAGGGVPESERARIFERFARSSASRHRVGTGLGLALVAEHVHALGGEVWVEDRPGGGARFVVRLPRGDHHHEAGL